MIRFQLHLVIARVRRRSSPAMRHLVRSKLSGVIKRAAHGHQSVQRGCSLTRQRTCRNAPELRKRRRDDHTCNLHLNIRDDASLVKADVMILSRSWTIGRRCTARFGLLSMSETPASTFTVRAKRCLSLSLFPRSTAHFSFQ